MTTKPLSVFVLTKTAGYHHACIPFATSSLSRLADRSNGAFTVARSSDDAGWLTDEDLAECDVVLFLHTTGDFLDGSQLAALQRFVRRGGGFVGVHGAAAAMDGEPWYTDLIGAGFVNHPEPQPGVVRVEDENEWLVWASPSSSSSPPSSTGAAEKGTFSWFDEWYNYTRDPRSQPGMRVLLSIDQACYEGGQTSDAGASPDRHPLAWYRELDGGRSFYTSLGHFDEAYTDERFMTHLLRGIVWAGRGTWPDPKPSPA